MADKNIVQKPFRKGRNKRTEDEDWGTCVQGSFPWHESNKEKSDTPPPANVNLWADALESFIERVPEWVVKAALIAVVGIIVVSAAMAFVELAYIVWPSLVELFVP